MRKAMKVLFVLALIFMFSAPSSAYVWNPADWIDHDAVAAEEDAKLFMERQQIAEEGVFRPFANIPAIPFGGNQNVSEAAWPTAMRKAMENAVPADVKTWLKTPAFDYSPGKHTISEDLPGNVGYITTQQEILDWFAALPTDRMQYKLITGFPYYTGNGYQDYALARTFELVLAVFSKPAAFTPEQVKAIGKPVVWLHGQIHGGETSPAEALLQIAKEFAEGKHDDVLDKITVVMVPRLNVDGAWNITRGTTALAPVGHAGAGSAGLDMNRDWVAFEAPIVRAARQLQIEYDAIAHYCGHQQGYTFDQENAPNAAGTGTVSTGYRRGYDIALTTSETHNLNLHFRVRDLADKYYVPDAKKVLESNNVGWDWYIAGSISGAMNAGVTYGTHTIPMDVISSDGRTGPIPGNISYTYGRTDFALSTEEGIAMNGMGIANQSIGFVYEVSSIGVRLDYLRRVYAQYLAALEITKTAARNVDFFMQEIDVAKVTEIGGRVPISFWGIAPPAMPNDPKNVFEFKDWRKEDIPEVVNSIGYGIRPTWSIRAHHAERDPNYTVNRPIAYIIPKDQYEAAIRLFYAGVKLERLTSDQEIEVEAYTVTETGNNGNRSPSGSVSQVNNGIRAVTKATIKKTFPKDSFVVRMTQIGASLAALAIEPLAIRNYGNMYLSRSPSTVIPEWYRDTFFPVAVGQEYPSYRYVSSASNPITTYPANINVPFMLTMVEKVHAFTQEEVADIKNKLGLDFDPEYLSKFQLPVLSTDAYKNMANVHVDESFVLPDGTVVKILPDFVLDGNIVKLVAPKGLAGNTVFAEKKDGSFGSVFQKELDPVLPEDVLVGKKAPDGAQIQANKLVWINPFKTKGVILSNSMLDGYVISGFGYGLPNIDEPDVGARGYSVELKGDELLANFNRLSMTNGTVHALLTEEGSAGVDQILIIEFRGYYSPLDDENIGCNAVHPLLILFTLVPFIIRKRR